MQLTWRPPALVQGRQATKGKDKQQTAADSSDDDAPPPTKKPKGGGGRGAGRKKAAPALGRNAAACTCRSRGRDRMISY